MSRTLPLLLCLTTALAFAQSPGAPAVGLRKAAEREARSNSTLGCKDLLEQTRVACREVFTRGLQVSCLMATRALSMASKQAGGALFSTGDGEKDARVANASCRVHLRSIERARKKSEGALADPSVAPPACAELATVLDVDCFDDFAKRGAFSRPCEQIFTLSNMNYASVAQMVRKPDAGEPPPGPVTEARCQAPLSVYRQLTKSAAP